MQERCLMAAPKNHHVLLCSMWCYCVFARIASSHTTGIADGFIGDVRSLSLDASTPVENLVEVPAFSAVTEPFATEPPGSTVSVPDPTITDASTPQTTAQPDSSTPPIPNTPSSSPNPTSEPLPPAQMPTPTPPPTEPPTPASTPLMTQTSENATSIAPTPASAAPTTSSASSRASSSTVKPTHDNQDTKDPKASGLPKRNLTFLIIVGAVVGLTLVFSLVPLRRRRQTQQHINRSGCDKNDPRFHRDFNIGFLAEEGVVVVADAATDHSADKTGPTHFTNNINTIRKDSNASIHQEMPAVPASPASLDAPQPAFQPNNVDYIYTMGRRNYRPAGVLWPANVGDFCLRDSQCSAYSCSSLVDDEREAQRYSEFSDCRESGEVRESMAIDTISCDRRDRETMQEVLSDHKRTSTVIDIEIEEEELEELSEFVICL